MIHVIVDTTEPLITGCPSNISTELGTAVTWNEPTATDQSGTPQRSRSHSPNTQFPIGVTTVRYLFTDTSSNTGACIFTIEIG